MKNAILIFLIKCCLLTFYQWLNSYYCAFANRVNDTISLNNLNFLWLIHVLENFMSLYDIVYINFDEAHMVSFCLHISDNFQYTKSSVWRLLCCVNIVWSRRNKKRIFEYWKKPLLLSFRFSLCFHCSTPFWGMFYE